MKILIKVTKEVLKRSMYCRPESAAVNCAIAEAAKELFEKPRVSYHREFSDTGVLLSSKPYIRLDDIYIWLPASADDFIIAFDELYAEPEKRLELPEVSFEVDVPSELIDQIGIGEIYKVLSESKTLELIHP